MFEQLGDRLDGVFRRLKGRGVITQPMLREGLREVRRALLEADVNFHVARDFLKRVEQRALGEKVLESVRPAEQIVKIVHDELIEVLGGASAESGLVEAAVPPSVIMLVGLQGSGKTTTAGKLARRFDRLGRRPTLVACDPYRPAAGEQLVTLAESIGVPVIHEPGQKDVVAIASAAVDGARRAGATHVIIDTAGRLQVDDELMDELARLKSEIGPQEVLLVADGMTGQEAVRIAQGFHETVGITGVILTKMDGDARGGAALSIKEVTGKPVKFLGQGEALDKLEKAIRQMNRESRAMFRESFAAINERFKRLYPMLFRGGKAELRLTDPHDMLETGVEIYAQPPGKRLGSLELMSVGEKELTAVALIFAIFQYKPSPFCLLDEVDAPLDEANIGRFAEAIQQMTDRSQFIVITHSKRTMEFADVLYGVTMEQPGVSKLVSVELRGEKRPVPAEVEAAE